ncbi:hypothetical protein [Lactiplantibacillus modestisalitolerans]|uniref:Integral membrane protein n=1 Tax=Lactiplantibacillus modestisalitolerans TaxID=1457219 RepID=A0ABV5WX34_9LACO|nr:hypothetical protein [Lactiplantibacillus modestisalitolerans]
MFWLPIFLSTLLIIWWGLTLGHPALSLDVALLFNVLNNSLWQNAPQPVQHVVHRSARDLNRIGLTAMVGCILLAVGTLLLIISFNGDPYQSSIITLLCAFDCYSFYGLFNRELQRYYAHRRYPQLKQAINYLMTAEPQTMTNPR